MHEVVNIHIGQSGTQIGHACWELNCIEHSITPDGRIDPELHTNDDSFKTFYNSTDHGKYVPRAVFVDTEPTVIDEIRSGPYSQLFHPEQLISGKEDAANNFARGYFNIGSIMIDSIMDRIRLIVEQCDSLQGFIIYHSLGGGTGSGLGSHMINSMTSEYTKRTKIEMCIFTSPRLQAAVVEPYNAVLGTHSCIEDSEVVFLLDNEAVWDVTQKKLNIKRPSFTNINRLLAQIISSLTAPLRFQGSLNGDLSEFQTNLVPYPRIHFPLASFSPIMPISIQKHEQNTVEQVTRSLFEPANSFLTVDITKGKYMSCVLLYRGDVDATSVSRATNQLKHARSIRFVDWCPTGFKIDINHQPVTVVPGGDLAPVPRNCAMLANTTAVGQSLVNNDRKFDLMFNKRAFIHWYVTEGLEETQMLEAMEDLHALEQDYNDAGEDTQL